MVPAKILVVEDDEAAARELSRSLVRLGYEVPAVLEHGEEAVEAAKRSTAQLALLSLGLSGGVGGTETGRKLREELRIPVIYLSGLQDLQSLERAAATDPAGYLVKPVPDEQLRTAIELALHRHRAESRLGEGEDRFGAMLRSLADAVVATDLEGRVTFMNPVAEKLTGWPLEDARGRLFREIVALRSEDPRAPEPTPCTEAVRRGETVSAGDFLLLETRDGRSVRVAGSASPLRGEDDVPHGAVLTLRERPEVEHAPAERLGGPRYSTIFRTSPMAILITSLTDDRVLEVNEAFTRLSGWTEQEAVGRTLLELGWWATPRDRGRVMQALRETPIVEDLEVTFCTRSGELRETLLSAEILEVEGERSVLTIVHDISDRKEFERELRRLALHDPLTDLPNRTLFHDRLDHAIDQIRRRGTKLAVLFLDLDGFKAVNDALGHSNGDELLRAVAERVRGCVREGDTFARFGGDEFAAVLEPIDGVGEARAVAERFAQALQEPFEVEGVRIPMSASIGIAIEGPGDVCPEEMVRAADFAMYRAKEVRGTSYRFADPRHDGVPVLRSGPTPRPDERLEIEPEEGPEPPEERPGPA